MDKITRKVKQIIRWTRKMWRKRERERKKIIITEMSMESCKASFHLSPLLICASFMRVCTVYAVCVTQNVQCSTLVRALHFINLHTLSFLRSSHDFSTRVYTSRYATRNSSTFCLSRCFAFSAALHLYFHFEWHINAPFIYCKWVHAWPGFLCE